MVNFADHSRYYENVFLFYGIFIKADHPSYDWRECLDASSELTYGHRWELFVLDLSFIGWQIVGSLCLGIGTFWVNAYREATIAEYYRYFESNQMMDRDF